MALQAQTTNAGRIRDDVKLLHFDSDLVIGGGNTIYIVLWRDRTTAEGVAAIVRTFCEHVTNHSREVAMVTIIEPCAKMPSPNSREPLAQFLRSASSHVRISAVAFEGDGFMAAGIRGVVVGLTLLARQAYPHRVFKDVTEASQWIESERSRIGKHFRARDIQASVSRLREFDAYTRVASVAAT